MPVLLLLAGNASTPIPLLLHLLAGGWFSTPAVAPAAERTPPPPGLASTPAPLSAPLPAGGASLAPVSAVDLNRYAGLWHEIARIPNRFQRQCVRDNLAVYTFRTDGSVAVLNQCVKRNGVVDQARGVARVVDRVSQARLKVSLVSFLGWRPFWGDYWIIGLDPDYRWAIVGEPRRRFGWILARTRSLDSTSWTTIQSILERNGYDNQVFRPSSASLSR
jgi:apolipoprotein D and lipocalin family protein